MAKKNQLTTSDHFKKEEYERLLLCLRKDKEYRGEMFAMISFCTACRCSDVLSLRWGDVLRRVKIQVVEKKTKKTREIPLNPCIQKRVCEIYDLMGRPESGEYIFKSSFKEDAPVTIQYINRQLKIWKLKYRLKIGRFSTHTFRKTFGRFVYDSSNRSAESLILLNKIFRHTSIEITKTYIGITQDEINSVFNSITI